jgi:histone H3/H4
MSDEPTNETQSQPNETNEKETVYELPRANIQRVVKNVLPEGFSIVNDAKVGFSKASMVFIMYLTAKYY